MSNDRIVEQAPPVKDAPKEGFGNLPHDKKTAPGGDVGKPGAKPVIPADNAGK